MSTFFFQCLDQALCLDGEATVASGGRDTDVVQFNFCRQWDGFTKAAVFCRRDGEATTRPLDENDACCIPAHLLDSEGILYIGAVGTNAEGVTRTSELLGCRVQMGTINKMTKPPAPTVSVYEQVLALITPLKSTAADGIPHAEKGAPDGVVPLDETGRVPMEMLNGAFFPQLVVTAEGGSKLTCICGETRLTRKTSDTGTTVVDLPVLGTWTVHGYRPGGKSITETVQVDDVRQYSLNFDLEFVAGLTVKTGKPLATMTALHVDTGKTFEATADAGGYASTVLTEPGEYTVSVAHMGLAFPTGTVTAIEDEGTYALDLHYFDPVLEHESWARIAQASKQGVAPQVWQVGDTKDIYDAKGAYHNTAVIIGFDHDELADGSGKASITFAYLKAHGTNQKYHNSELSGVYVSFVDSSLYKNDYEGDLWTSEFFDAELQAAVKTVNKLTAKAKATTEGDVEAVGMKVFLLSEVEVTGAASLSIPGEGAQYQYFATEDSRLCKDKNGALRAWRLRSPYAADQGTGYNACHVAITTEGGTDYYVGLNGDYFYDRPGFCI